MKKLICKIFLLVLVVTVIGLTVFKIYGCEDNKDEVSVTEVESVEPAEVTTELVVQASEFTPEKPKLKSLGVYRCTAYCACSRCCGKSDGITASGAKAVEGVTIAASKNFAFGTKLIIDGHEYTVQDRGGGIKGNRIDIFFSSHRRALAFGVQYKEVFIKG